MGALLARATADAMTAAREERNGPGRRERGATLFIALVMLALMMIHALASFMAADTQLRNVGSLQARQEAQAAAQLAIARVIGSSAFVTSPPVSPIDIDVDGDGFPDYRVALSAGCSAARALTSIAIPPPTADDAACLAASSPSGDIPCADTTWDIQAIATRRESQTQSGAMVEVHQGVTVRLEAGEAMRSCPGLPPSMSAANTPLALGKARKKTHWYVRPGT